MTSRKLTREIKFGVWVLAAVVIGAAAFVVGSGLKPGEDPYYVFDVDAAAYEDSTAVAATSQGGFTGFGEVDGSDSRTVLGGRVVEMTDTSITLESPSGHRTSLSFGESPHVTRLQPATPEILRPGVTVAVLIPSDGDTVEAVLVLSQP